MGCSQILGRCGKVGESFSQPAKNRWVCAGCEVQLQILVRFIISKRTGFIFWQIMVGRKSNRTKGYSLRFGHCILLKNCLDVKAKLRILPGQALPSFMASQRHTCQSPNAGQLFMASSGSFPPKKCLKTLGLSLCTTETHSNCLKSFRLEWHGREQSGE